MPAYAIHGERDELFPLPAVETTLAARKSAGKEVKFRLLAGVTHYDTSAFIAPLRDAAPWLSRHLDK